MTGSRAPAKLFFMAKESDLAAKLRHVARMLESIPVYHGPSNGGDLQGMIRMAELAAIDLKAAIREAKQ